MEDKMFELMEKMYADITKKLDENYNSLKDEIQTVGNQVAKIENDLKPKVEAALDGYKLVYEKLQEHDKRFDELSQKVDNQELDIKVIKAVK